LIGFAHASPFISGRLGGLPAERTHGRACIRDAEKRADPGLAAGCAFEKATGDADLIDGVQIDRGHKNDEGAEGAVNSQGQSQ